MIASLLAEASNDGSTEMMPIHWVTLVVLICVYFLPTLIALIRKVRNLGSVIVVNVFLGWTLIGWVVALAMSMRTVDRV